MYICIYMRIKAITIPALLVTAVVFCSFTRKFGDPELNQRFNRIAPYRQHPDTAVIRVIGDVMLHSAQIGCDYSTFLSGIEDDLKSADIAIANMEFSLGGAPYTGYPAFSAPDTYAEYAANTGIDIFLTANNHILDRGKKGLERTLSIYDGMSGIDYAGTGTSDENFAEHNPLYIRAKGIKIALVNATYGTNAGITPGYPEINCLTSMDAIGSQVREAKRNGAEYVIAFPHWGYEYKTRHNKFQQNQAQQMASSGADMIIGAHPHVVQDTGSVRTPEKTVPVFYSLGNAVSNMSAANTQVELMVTVRIVAHLDGSTEMLPPTYDWLWCSLPGRLCSGYKTIKIEDYVGRKEEWIIKDDYDKMIASWIRVKNETGLN